MHELGISRNIAAIVCEAAKGRRVRRIVLQIGLLSGVMPDAIRFSFEAVAYGTVLEGATLDIDEIEGRARCTDCTAEFALTSLHVACPCGSRKLLPIAGQELNIKSMEIEEAA